MKYAFEAVDTKGRTQKGVLEAEREREVQRALKQQGLTLIKVAPVRRASEKSLFKHRLTAQDLILVLEGLSLLMEAGVAIADAVNTVGAASPHQEIRLALEDVERALRAGGRLSTALAGALPRLPGYVVPIVEAGEAVGAVGPALSDAAEHMAYEDESRREVRQALTYPVILVSVGIAAVLFIFVVVVPRFAGMLERGGGEAPWLAMAVINTGLFFNEYWGAIVIAFVALFIGGASALGRPAFRARAYGSLVRLPVVGTWLRESEIALWAAMLATMLSNKVVLLESLEMARRSIKDQSFQNELEQAEIAVRGGQSLAEALGKGSGFNATALNLVRVGEEAGELPTMLRSLWKLYDRSGRERMKKFLALLEPAAILLIGGVIGTIVAAILLAITSIQQVAL